MKRAIGVRTMFSSFKNHPNYESYKEKIVYSILIISCVLSSFPILVPDSYFIKQKADHDAHAAAEEEEEGEEEE